MRQIRGGYIRVVRLKDGRCSLRRWPVLAGCGTLVHRFPKTCMRADRLIGSLNVAAPSRSEKMNLVVFGLLGYVLVQFAIGVAVSRRIASEKDYILAGRSLGPVLVTFSVFATWFGAEAIVATPGEVYKNGLAGATVDPFAYSAAVILAGALLAGRLWRRGITTFADMFRERYSVTVERLAWFKGLSICLFTQPLKGTRNISR